MTNKIPPAPTLQSAVNRYMEYRGIGESAVDLIPDQILRPWGPIRTNNQFNWVHTPGRVKWGVFMVRQAMAEIK